MRKRAALYSRISTGDQHLETQLLDLREMAKQRGYEIVREYSDVTSGAKAKHNYQYAPNESVVATFTATTFFSHDLEPGGAAPAGKPATAASGVSK